MDNLYNFLVENNISKDENILNNIHIHFIKQNDIVSKPKLKYVLYSDYADENCIFD